MCLLIPAEMSTLLTSLVGVLFCGALVVTCGSCCNCGRGCSAARRGLVCVKNNTIDRAMISRVIIGSQVRFCNLLSWRSRWRADNSYILLGGLNSFTVFRIGVAWDS